MSPKVSERKAPLIFSEILSSAINKSLYRATCNEHACNLIFHKPHYMTPMNTHNNKNNRNNHNAASKRHCSRPNLLPGINGHPHYRQRKTHEAHIFWDSKYPSKLLSNSYLHPNATPSIYFTEILLKITTVYFAMLL